MEKLDFVDYYKEANHKGENIIENYRRLGFNLENLYTMQVLGIIIEKDNTYPRKLYETPKEYVEHLRTLDGSNDLDCLEALLDDISDLIRARKPWFITVKGKELVNSMLESLPTIKHEWIRRNTFSDKGFSASEKEEFDLRLFYHLTDIKYVAERLWLTTEEKIEVVADNVEEFR